ncbi:MAG TPA: type III pantothenate kinase, partial [Bacillota bacterium]|nr:type III pantothenate kinase [Bacillota bacterium]
YRQKTADEYGVICLQLFHFYHIDPAAVQAAVIASVVPTVEPAVRTAVRDFLHINPLMVQPGLTTGLSIRYDHPEKLGSDRLANAVAAYTLYGGPVIIVDLGTATKLCVVTARGEYLGGIIAPGIKALTEILTKTADKLPRFEPVKPPKVVGTNTVACMQSGIIYGQIAMLSGLIRRIKSELGLPAVKVVATGGLADLVAPEIPAINTVNPLLTLEGLRIIYEMNPSFS